MTAYDESVDRTRQILRRQFSNDILTRAWEVELARTLGVELPARAVEDLGRLWEATGESYDLGRAHTFVRTLVDAGIPLPGKYELVQRIANMQSGGRFASRASSRSELEDAWNAVDILAALGERPRDQQAAIAWIRSRQQPDGSFRAQGESLWDTLYGLRALSLLGGAPADPTMCTAWLLAHEATDLTSTWLLTESIAIIGGLGMWIGGDMIDRWDSLEFSLTAESPAVSHEAYMAIRTRQHIDATTAMD